MLFRDLGGIGCFCLIKGEAAVFRRCFYENKIGLRVKTEFYIKRLVGKGLG